MQTNNSQFKPRRNYQIKAPQVRLIDSSGVNLGVVSLQEALSKAKEQSLDLIEINHKSNPVIVKIADYGKMLYEEKKKAQAAKKNQQNQELKELTFRPNTDTNDLLHKLNQAKEFLSDGCKVKFSIKFRGREIVHTDIGKEKFNWILNQLDGLILPNSQISLEGKIMWMMVLPAKKN